MASWILDAAHSSVGFKVKHLAITTVSGSFSGIDGSVEAGESFENAKISFTADISTISTANEQRDGHLKSGDFFDAENFPKLSFESTSFTGSGEDWKLKGNLTIKGVTKAVELDVEFGGTMKDPWGNMKAGFTVTGKINRKDFGLTWNAITEAGSMLVSEDVKLIADIQLLQQA